MVYLLRALGVFANMTTNTMFSGTRWDDLRFPAQGINPAGAASPPTVDDTTFPGTLLFATNATNVIAGVAQLPHAWKRGTAQEIPT